MFNIWQIKYAKTKPVDYLLENIEYIKISLNMNCNTNVFFRVIQVIEWTNVFFRVTQVSEWTNVLLQVIQVIELYELQINWFFSASLTHI